MTTPQLAAFAFFVVAMFSMIVLADVLISRTIWKWCPKCGRYHSHLGVTDTYPLTGVVAGSELCDECSSPSQSAHHTSNHKSPNA